jgi:hypothetical protein
VLPVRHGNKKQLAVKPKVQDVTAVTRSGYLENNERGINYINGFLKINMKMLFVTTML